MISNVFDHLTAKSLGYFEPDPRRTMKSPTLLLVETLEAFNARPVPVLTPSLKKEVGPAKRTSIAPKIAWWFIAGLLALPVVLVTDIIMHGTGLAAEVPKNLAPKDETMTRDVRDLPVIGRGSTNGEKTVEFLINGQVVQVTSDSSWVELTCGKGLKCE